MACYHPLPARQVDGGLVKLWPPKGDANLWLPCGTCLGCKRDRAQVWATRASHEASLHEDNVFITLTYADQHLPAGEVLVPRDLTLFLKRLRKTLATGDDRFRGRKLRYLACGEYGDLRGRPHYHVCAFGLGVNRLRSWKKDVFEAPDLMDIWQKGQVTVGAFTAAAAAYTASYCMKSMGKNYCDADGLVKPPPFLRCSNRPGIGMPWLEKYHRDLTTGFVIENGDKKKIPRYYKKKLPEVSETSAATVAVKMNAQRNDPNNAKKQNPDRRHAAEVMHKRRLELTRKRTL